MDITLSISLLASDRRDSLERCLDSLKPLLVKVPSELIVVLTGTDEKIRKIAEKYTSQIVSFTWCGDFSAARNAGLKEAQGEWFLYIDDDEWFDNVDEICRFFCSGEYRRYRSAHYIQRNYQDWNGTKYTDFSAFRMVQRTSEIRFFGEIHEELTPRMEPCKYFQTCVHHYGYVKDAGNIRKTSRNTSMLLRAIEDWPEQIKNYIQIAKEFELSGDFRSAEEYCRKGRKVCRERNDPDSEGWLQAYLSHLMAEKPARENAVSELEEILAKEHPRKLTCLVLYQQLVHLCAEAKDAEKAVGYGWKFEKLLKEMDEQESLWEQQSYGEFCENYIKAPERLYGTRAECASCALSAQDWASAAYFLKLFPWETEDILCRYYPDLEEWKETYGGPYIEILLGILKDMSDGSDSSGICSLGEDSDVPVPVYLLCQKALDGFNKDLFEYCMSHTEDFYMQQQLLKEAIYHQVSVLPFVSRMDLDTWDELTGKAVKELSYSLNDRIRACEEEIKERYPLHSLCLKKYRLVQELCKGFPLWDVFIDDLNAYCQCVKAFYNGLYRDEWFGDGMRGFLPAECRFAMMMSEALEALGQERMRDAVGLLGKAYHIYPDMSGAITELFRQAARRLDDPALHGGEEFRLLAGQMKETLKTLMESGQTVQASEVLDRLLPLMPEDLELVRIRQELIRRTKP